MRPPRTSNKANATAKPRVTAKPQVWGIHMGKNVGAQAIDEGFIAIGWPDLGKFSDYPNLNKFKSALKKNCSESNRRSRGQRSGVFDRFVYKMKEGDIVVFPSKHDGKVNIGYITGDVECFDHDIDELINRRPVKWLKHLPRTKLSYDVLSEIRAYLAIFQIRKNEKEFQKMAKEGVESQESDDKFEDTIGDFSKKAEYYAQVFVIEKILDNLSNYEFEKLFADILKAMGYTAYVTQETHDGGFDVIAHKDRLGCKPPILKVQCKRKAGNPEIEEIRSLLGILGKGECGIFVSLGAYSTEAIRIERLDPRIKLIDGAEFFNLICEYYDRLSPVYRNLFPLKKIYVADIFSDILE